MTSNASSSVLLMLAVVAGGMMAVQTPTNAMLGRALGSPALSALVSFAIGTLILASLCMAWSVRAEGAALRTVPWYAWAGGLYGALFVTFAAFAAPRLGVGPLLTAIIAGQIVTALALDHMGALGLSRQPLSLPRIAGALLVVAGALLVRRG